MRGHQGPLKEKAVGVLTALVILITFITTWAAFYNHQTILAVLVVVGSALAILLAYLYASSWHSWKNLSGKLPAGPPVRARLESPGDPVLMVPKASAASAEARLPGPGDSDAAKRAEIIEAEYDKVSKENGRLRLKLEQSPPRQEEDKYKTTALPEEQPGNDVETRKNHNQDAAPSAVVYPAHFFHSGSHDYWTEYTEDVFKDVIWRWHYKKEIDKTPRDLKAFSSGSVTMRALNI